MSISPRRERYSLPLLGLVLVFVLLPLASAFAQTFPPSQASWIEVERNLRRLYETRTGVSLEPITTEELAPLLDGAGAILVAFTKTGGSGSAFVVDATSVRSIELSGTANSSADSEPFVQRAANLASSWFPPHFVSALLDQIEKAGAVSGMGRLYLIPPSDQENAPWAAAWDLAVARVRVDNNSSDDPNTNSSIGPNTNSSNDPNNKADNGPGSVAPDDPVALQASRDGMPSRNLGSTAEEMRAAIGEAPPLSLLPAAAFLRGRISPRTRAGSGFTLFAEDLETAQRFARRNDLVWLGEEATGSRFAEDKDTRDSDVIHFAVPVHVASDGLVRIGGEAPKEPIERTIEDSIGEPTELTAEATEPTAETTEEKAGLDSLSVIAPELAADWISLFSLTTADDRARTRSIYQWLDRRSRSIAINRVDLPEQSSLLMGEILFQNLRMGLARDEAIRRTRQELASLGWPLRDLYALEFWGAGNLPVYAIVPATGIGGLVIAWLIFLVSGFFVVSFIGRRFAKEPKHS